MFESELLMAVVTDVFFWRDGKAEVEKLKLDDVLSVIHLLSVITTTLLLW